jgi:hypothetical protein
MEIIDNIKEGLKDITPEEIEILEILKEMLNKN